VKDVKKCNAFLVHRVADIDEIWHFRGVGA